MRMIKVLYLLIILLILAGCSFLTEKIERLSVPNLKDIKTNSYAIKNIYCFESNKIQLLFEDEATVKYYRPLLTEFFDSKNYTFIQKAAILSLIEMSRRPDEASPTARLQYFLRFNKKSYYFDFYPKNFNEQKQMSYLKGLDVLLKNFDNSKNLTKLSLEIDQKIPKNINVSAEFENFLQENRIDIVKTENLATVFLKGDEVLTRHESFKRDNLKKLIDIFNKEYVSKDSMDESSKDSLINVNTEHPTLTLKCNIDINKETVTKEKLSLSEQTKAHTFALKDGDNFFIAVSSVSVHRPIKNFESTYYIKSQPASSPLPFCQISSSLQDIILFSTSGKNPAQHLKHLISYDINLVDSFQALNDILKFSRHLFLSNPDRILYESKRGRKSQLDFFLSMDFPIYHAESIGNIIGFGAFKNDKNETMSLISDDRSKNRLWCGP